MFSVAPDKIASIGERIITEVTKLAADAGGQTVDGNLAVPELGLSVLVQPSGGLGVPMRRVHYEPLLSEPEWEHHWKMAALQIKDPIEAKGRKPYSVPSILAIDVSRLGEAGRMPPGARRLADLFTGEGPVEPWTTEFQQVQDGCELGNLRGVLLVRSTLTSRMIEPLCWRGGESMLLAAGAVISDDQLQAAG